MDKRPVLFIDSGLGSLPYGNFFHSRNRHEELICIGDCANFPYGTKSRETLIALLDSLTEKIISAYDPKILALVCNTASVTALDFLREKYADLPIVGTVPAIKPSVLASKTRKLGLIGSERTVEDPYIAKLAAAYGPDCEIILVAAPELIEFAQYRYGNSAAAERLAAVSPYVDELRSSGVDSIVLGCTHFLLLHEDFKAAAGKDIGVYDSVEGVTRRLESILDEEDGKLRSQTRHEQIVPVIAVTGGEKPESYWDDLARRSGFSLQRFL